MIAEIPNSPAWKEASRVLRDSVIDPDETVLLAISGGSDSVALLLLATRVLSSSRVLVGFVDHGLREGIDAEWLAVADLSRELGAEAARLQIRDAPSGGNIQEWARGARYAVLSELARARGIRLLLTGHTFDDQAETVLLRILRGSGLDGLRGIPEKADLDGGLSVCRPLIGLRRMEIQNWLTAAGVRWITDPSNRNSRFRRVRIRHELLPLMEQIAPGAAEHLVALSREAASVTADMAQNSDYEKCLIPICLNKGFKVKHECFESMSDDRRSRLVRHLLRRVRGDLRRVERVHVSAVVAAMMIPGRTRLFEFPGGAIAVISFGDLYAFPEPLVKPRAASVPVVNGTASLPELGIRVDVVGDSSGDLVLRTRRKGDLLAGSSRTIADRLKNSRIPPFYRDFFPVLCLGELAISTPAHLTSTSGALTVQWTMIDRCPLRDLFASFDQRL